MSVERSWSVGSIHHIGLTVSDIERSIAFYRDTLGLIMVGRRPKVDNDYVATQTGFPGVELSVASFKQSETDPVSLEVVQYLTHAAEPVGAGTNRAGASHLCLRVSDLAACHADLSAKGVRFKSDPVTITAGPNEGGMVIYLFDPDGYTIELFQPRNS